MNTCDLSSKDFDFFWKKFESWEKNLEGIPVEFGALLWKLVGIENRYYSLYRVNRLNYYLFLYHSAPLTGYC